MGRRAYEMADPDSYDWDDYEYQVPIFVLTHHVPKKIPKENDRLTFTFVADGVQSAIAKAKRPQVTKTSLWLVVRAPFSSA